MILVYETEAEKKEAERTTNRRPWESGARRVVRGQDDKNRKKSKQIELF